MILLFSIIFGVYCIALGVASVINENVKLYQNDGYIDINLKWFFINILQFLLQSVLGVVKYVVAGVTVLGSLCLVILAGLMEANVNDFPFPNFMKDWFKADAILWSFIWSIVENTAINLWRFVKWIGRGLKAIGKLLFIAPFVWIHKKCGKLFDTSIFTIGSKPKK